MVLTQILIKFLFQNLDQASSTKSQPNIIIWTKLKLQVQVLDQSQLQNLVQDSTSYLYKTSAAKY